MSWARLLLRHLRLSGARWAVLALVVALTSATATAWPRWLATTTTGELRRDLGSASRIFVDPAAAPTLPTRFAAAPPGSAGEVAPDADPWGWMAGALATARDALPEPLRGTLGEPGYWATLGTMGAEAPDATGLGQLFLQPASAPQLLGHAQVAEGRAPSASAPGDVSEGKVRLEVAMSVESARALGWAVGAVRDAGAVTWDAVPIEVQLTATFEPDDPDSSYWQNASGLLHPTYTHTPTGDLLVTARGLVSDGAGLRTATSLAGYQDRAARLWFPLDVDRVDVDTAGLLAEQLRTELQAVRLGRTGLATEFASDAPDRIDEVLGRAHAAGSVLALTVAAPAGVLLALLALAAQVVVAPRRGTHLLTALRGASTAQHRWLLGTEAAVACLPAAALGALAARALVPAAVSPWWWLAPAALGLVPVLAMATASPSPRARVPRVAVEAGVAVLAAAAVTELVRHGVDDSAGTNAIAVAAPPLLAVLTALICARVVPLVVRPLSGRLRRRDDLVTPLGATLAARRTPPLAATISMAAGTAVALLGVLVVPTLDAGRVAAATGATGADLHIQGILDDGRVAALRAVPGVARVAPVVVKTWIALQAGSTRVAGKLYVADDDLTAVQANVPGHVAVPPVGTVTVPSASGVAAGDLAELTTTPRTPVTVSTVDGAPGLTTARTWMLVSRETLADQDLSWEPTGAYLALDPDADPVAVAAAVRDLVGTDVTVTTAHERLEQLRTAPTARALSVGILVVVAAGLVTAALAVALALAARSATRSRVVAVLRTMGLPPRAEVRLVLWEAAPSVGVAVAAGTGLGFALAALLLACVDLRPFTGGAAQPHLVVGPAAVAGALGVVLAVATAAVLVSAWVAARRSAAVVLRAGEDRT